MGVQEKDGAFQFSPYSLNASPGGIVHPNVRRGPPASRFDLDYTLRVNILFVCTENRLRSATAEAVFCDRVGIDAIGAGTNADAPTPVSGDLIEWADVVLVMETTHREKIARKYQRLLKGKKLAVLNIPDRYTYMQPELVELLERIVPRYLNV